MSAETWYVMADGSCADPREIGPGPDGKLRHKDGRAVAYAPHGPRSRSVDPVAERAKSSTSKQPPADETLREMAATDTPPAGDDREMKPSASGRGYRTRGSKAD